jgi:hypothetical protein
VQLGFFPGVKRPELEAEHFHPVLSYSLHLLSPHGFIVWTVVREIWEVRKNLKGRQRRNLKREIILLHRNMYGKYGKH